MGPGSFNMRAHVIPECVAFWNLHLICLRSSMKILLALPSPSRLGFRGISYGWRGLQGPTARNLVRCHFLSSYKSSSLLTTPSFSSKDPALFEPNVIAYVNPMKSNSLLSFATGSISQRLEQEIPFKMLTYYMADYFKAGSLKVSYIPRISSEPYQHYE